MQPSPGSQQIGADVAQCSRPEGQPLIVPGVIEHDVEVVEGRKVGVGRGEIRVRHRARGDHLVDNPPRVLEDPAERLVPGHRQGHRHDVGEGAYRSVELPLEPSVERYRGTCAVRPAQTAQRHSERCQMQGERGGPLLRAARPQGCLEVRVRCPPAATNFRGGPDDGPRDA
ncbi:hypothetical protein SBADM41S_04509 [Streptomyces badius]